MIPDVVCLLRAITIRTTIDAIGVTNMTDAKKIATVTTTIIGEMMTDEGMVIPMKSTMNMGEGGMMRDEIVMKVVGTVDDTHVIIVTDGGVVVVIRVKAVVLPPREAVVVDPDQDQDDNLLSFVVRYEFTTRYKDMRGRTVFLMSLTPNFMNHAHCNLLEDCLLRQCISELPLLLQLSSHLVSHLRYLYDENVEFHPVDIYGISNYALYLGNPFTHTVKQTANHYCILVEYFTLAFSRRTNIAMLYTLTVGVASASLQVTVNKFVTIFTFSALLSVIFPPFSSATTAS